MNKYLKLTRLLLKSGLGISFSSKGSGGKKQSRGKNNKKVMIALMAICFLPLIALLFGLGRDMYVVFNELNMSKLAISLICYGASIVILFFAMPYSISVFFLSSDLDTLLPLPLKPWQIVAAKFTSILAYEYITLAVFIVPILLGYGIASSAGILYWLFMIVVFLMIPIIPLVYASLLSILLMRALKNFKNKELLTTLGSVVLILCAVGINFFIRSSQNQVSAITDFLVSNQALIQNINYVFPNLFFAGDILVDTNILSLVPFVIVTVLFVVVFLFLGDKFYLGGVLGMSEVTSRKRKMTSAQKDSYTQQKSPVVSYAMKEIKLLLRTPVYMVNCIMMPILMPLIMFGAVIFSLLGESGGQKSFSHLSGLFTSEMGTAACLMVILGLTLMVGSFNLVTSTCISREGKGYIFMKYIPLSYKEQLRGKVLSGLIVSSAAVLPYIVICCALSVWMFGASILVVPFSIVISFVTILLINYIQLLSDLTFPKLEWENEQLAVKQNISATLMMLLLMFLSVIVGGSVAVVYLMSHIPAVVLALIYCVIMGGIVFLVRKGVYRYGVEKLEELED